MSHYDNNGFEEDVYICVYVCVYINVYICI